ncbi:MAG: hypothetical protein U9R25_13230 [Chloroflexota bacterium]|nr:hypothetical protein [Chloroflexota bacterium]
MRPKIWIPVLVVFALIAAACGSNSAETGGSVIATGSCSLELPADLSDEQVIWSLIAAESEYMVGQKIDELMRLWSGNALITDVGNTPDDRTDDQTWKGQDAIRYRYVRNIFPSAPMLAAPDDLNIHLIGADRAEVTSTTRINLETSPAGDRWELLKDNGCWYLDRLEYNRELQ